jgi:hypothetical protein
VFFGVPQKKDIESRELGALLYCEECANVLFTDRIWDNAKPLRVEMTPEDAHSAEGRDARSEVIDFSIALAAKRRGVSSSQALRDARELGDLWWIDQPAAKRRLTPPPRPFDQGKIGPLGFCAFLGIPLFLDGDLAGSRPRGDRDTGWDCLVGCWRSSPCRRRIGSHRGAKDRREDPDYWRAGANFIATATGRRPNLG